MAIIVSRAGGAARIVEPVGIQAEADLEKYVADNPQSLPIQDIKEGARLMVLARQFPTNSGELDVLAIDSDGDLYVIETKLYNNPDKRTVVAQVLDYGASLWRTYGEAPDEFVSEVDGRLTTAKRGGLVSALAEFFQLDQEESRATVECAKTNLQAGNIRFVVLMNRLHDPLKDLIQFLNQRSGFHIYAVEMEFYRHEDMEIVIPKLFGGETVKTIGEPRVGKRKWNESSFFTDASRQLNETQLTALRNFYKFSVSEGRIAWGSGKRYGSFIARFPSYDEETLYYVSSDGSILLCVIWLPRHGDENQAHMDRRKKLFVDAGFIDPADVPASGFRDCIELPAEAWLSRVDRFISVIRDLLEEAQETSRNAEKT